MATVWRCNWCGKRQPFETLTEAAQGEYVASYCGWQVRLPVHNCCPEHEGRTRAYVELAQRWMWPFTAASTAAVVVAAVGFGGQSRWLAALGLAAMGAVLLLLPLARNTVKMGPDTEHSLLRWLGDVLMPNATPGDLLICWHTCIVIVRATGAVVILLGLLCLLGVLQ